MKISSLSRFTTFSAAAIFTGLVLLTVQISKIQETIVDSEEQRFQSHRLAEEMRQSSDDLTRMARAYVVTGDAAYERRYFELLDIHNGKLPQPKNYSAANWDVHATSAKRPPASDGALSLQERIRRLNFNAQELHLLRESQARVDVLVKLEKQAFAAAKRLHDDGQGEFTVPGATNHEYAAELLHSPQYQTEKVRVMEPIQQALMSVDGRINGELSALRIRQQQYVWLVLALSLSALFGVALATVHIRRAVMRPLARLGQQAAAIAQGDYETRCDINSSNELATLGAHFNVMAGAIERDILERKQAEDELRVSEERWSFALEGAGEGVWDWNLETNRLMVSRRAARALGYSGNASWKSLDEWQEHIHPDDMPQMMADLEAYLAGKTPSYVTENRVRCKDGSWKWMLTRGMVVQRYANGKALRMIGVQADISERKRVAQHEQWRNYVLELMAQAVPLPEILHALVRSVEDESPDMLCSILLLDSSGRHFLTGAAPRLPESFNQAVHGIAIGPGVGSCGTAAHTRQRAIVEDIQSDPSCAQFKELATVAGLRSCWSEPILSATWKLLGTFAIYRRTPGSPSASDITLIERAAGLAAIAIEKHDAEEALQLAAMVYQHSAEAIIVSDADDNIIAVNPAFTQLTGYTIEEVVGKKPNHFSSRLQDRATYRIIRRALKTSNTWQGEMWNRRKNGEEFVEWLTINIIRHEDGTRHRHVYLFSNITEKKRSEELIWHQANYDLLTGLPNRRLFRDRLDHEIRKSHRTGMPMALFFIDMDLFKEINDTLGHDVGDSLLIEAARRVCSSVRAADTVARLGGDEFTVILTELNEASKIEQIARQILQKLAEPFMLAGEVVYLSASIGITLYPSDTTEPENLIKNADQAMYVAKSEGRNRYSFFTRSMQEHAQTRMRLGNDLRGALASGQLALHFQPIIDLSNGHIIKAEALLRWNHPVRGMVSPSVFIPIAEESGLINEIGDWVFRQAVSWAQRWSAQLGRSFQISVNKSPVQFVSQTEYTAWPTYMEQLGLPGNCITVEITEGMLLNAAPCVNEKLLQFRDAGIQVSIDDFGTGYSSMSYLKKFHIDFLKIDQSFVLDMTTDAGDRAIAEAIIVMAHKLGYKVIAEGIETQEQRDMLTAADCDFGQGYLFAKAMPPEEFEVLLANDVGY